MLRLQKEKQQKSRAELKQRATKSQNALIAEAKTTGADDFQKIIAEIDGLRQEAEEKAEALEKLKTSASREDDDDDEEEAAVRSGELHVLVSTVPC